MIEGAAILLVGMVIGYWVDRRVVNHQIRHMGSVAKMSKPLCSCGHAPSFHNRETNTCHAEWKRPSSGAQLSKWVQCTCRRYDGPEPLPEFYAPELPQ